MKAIKNPKNIHEAKINVLLHKTLTALELRGKIYERSRLMTELQIDQNEDEMAMLAIQNDIRLLEEEITKGTHEANEETAAETTQPTEAAAPSENS